MKMEHFILLDFKSNITTYWNYIYGFIIVVGVFFLIIWMAEIMAALKKDAKHGKEQLYVWLLAAGLFFGVVPFLSEIMSLFGVNVTGI